MDKHDFDYIIVGSGPSAIGLIYGLLEAHTAISSSSTTTTISTTTGSRIEQVPLPTIAIIERGCGPQHHDTTASPRNWYQASHEVSSKCSVQIVPSTITGRVVDLPIGQGIGGTSNVNAGLCHPPKPEDFDTTIRPSCRWPEPWKSSLYPAALHLQQILDENRVLYKHPSSFHSVVDVDDTPPLTFLQQQHQPENDHDGDEDSRNDGGACRRSDIEFFPAVQTLAQPRKDENGNVRDFRRINYYDGLLQPMFEKHHSLTQSIHWFRGWEAQRLLLDEDDKRQMVTRPRVSGVECARVNIATDNHNSTQQDAKRKFITIRSNRRTIVCAGALETPALLLVSFPSLVDEDSIIWRNNNTNDCDSQSYANVTTASMRKSTRRNDKVLVGVGKGLKDQSILARIFFRFRQPCSKKYQKLTSSTNGIDELGHLHVPSTGSENTIENGVQCLQLGIGDKISHNFLPETIAIMMRLHSHSPFWSRVFEWSSKVLESFLSFALRYTLLGSILDRYVTSTLFCLMHPTSSGSVKIAVKDSYNVQHDGPLRRQDVTIAADPGYLSDGRDIVAMRNAWDHYGRIVKNWEIFPMIPFSVLGACNSNCDWFKIYCQHLLLPYFHFAGSCSMKTSKNDDDETYAEDEDEDNDKDDTWVVEPSRLQLRGFDGISLCDTSVFPSMVSNPPALTCAAMGYLVGKNLAKDFSNKKK